MVHIALYHNEKSPLFRRGFSNFEEVELKLNGRSLGVQKPDNNNISGNLGNPPFTFILDKFEEGELIAVGYIGEKAVATHSLKTPEAPSQY